MANWSEKLYKADISISSSGDNTIIAAPGAGKRIAIDLVNVLPTSAVSVQMKDGTTNYGGAYPLDAKQPFVFENTIQNYDGIITLSANSAFILNLGSAVQVGGFVRYRILDQS